MTEAFGGGFADPALGTASAFRAALLALSRPGTVHVLDRANVPPALSQAAGILALTLCDPETGLWLAPSVDLPTVRDWLTFHAGVPLVSREEAAFAIGQWEEMLPLADFWHGSPEYPDRSATLIVECPDLVTGADGAHRLTGPGIETEIRLTVPDPAALRANRAAFPLGLDFFLTSGNRVVGLPRTTIIEG